MKNITSEGFVEDAIIFCETPGECKTKLKLHDIEEALALIPGAARLKAPSKMFALGYNGQRLFVGTLIDMQTCNVLADLVEMGQTPYVACYDWQVELYRDIVGIPEDKILVINN